MAGQWAMNRGQGQESVSAEFTASTPDSIVRPRTHRPLRTWRLAVTACDVALRPVETYEAVLSSAEAPLRRTSTPAESAARSLSGPLAWIPITTTRWVHRSSTRPSTVTSESPFDVPAWSLHAHSHGSKHLEGRGDVKTLPPRQTKFAAAGIRPPRVIIGGIPKRHRSDRRTRAKESRAAR